MMWMMRAPKELNFRKITLLFFCTLLLGLPTYGKDPICALYPISEESPSGQKFGYIDCKGKTVVKPEFATASDFDEGVGLVLRHIKKEGVVTEFQTGIIDLRGQIIFLPSTVIYFGFSEGLALARSGKKYAFIDRRGRLRIRIPDRVVLDEAAPLHGSFINGFAYLNGPRDKIRVSRSGVFTRCRRIRDGCAIPGETQVLDTPSGYALIDGGGKYLLKPQEHRIYSTDDLYRLELPENKWKYLNAQGRLVFEVTYEYSGFFSEGLAIVKDHNKWGYIDKKGKIVIPIQFEEAQNFEEGLAPVRLNGKYGFIDKKGTFTIPAAYDGVIKPFNYGLAYVQDDKNIGYIDKRGNWIWKKPL